MTDLNDLTYEMLVSNFQLLGNWEDRYRYILDLAKKLPPFPENYRTEENRIHGCQSQVWMSLRWEGNAPGRLQFVADSDAHLVRGIIAILYILFCGNTPEDILALDVEDAINRLDLKHHLSPTRNNGLNAMIQRIRDAAQNKINEE
jgi:cysteine desulfuration protein SufE